MAKRRPAGRKPREPARAEAHVGAEHEGEHGRAVNARVPSRNLKEWLTRAVARERQELCGPSRAVLDRHGIVACEASFLPVFEEGRAPTPAQRREAERAALRLVDGQVGWVALMALGVKAVQGTTFTDADGAPVDVHAHPDPLVGTAAEILECLDGIDTEIATGELSVARVEVDRLAVLRAVFVAQSLEPLAEKGMTHLAGRRRAAETRRQNEDRRRRILTEKAGAERERLARERPGTKARVLDDGAAKVSDCSGRTLRRWRCRDKSQS